MFPRSLGNFSLYIFPFSQVKEIESHFRSTEITELEDIKVTTIDSFQVGLRERFSSLRNAPKVLRNALSVCMNLGNFFRENKI